MDSDNKEVLYLERAKNEIELARAVFKISTDNTIKTSLEIKESSTFFSNVISNSYYCIFYSAKALGINIKFKYILVVFFYRVYITTI